MLGIFATARRVRAALIFIVLLVAAAAPAQQAKAAGAAVETIVQDDGLLLHASDEEIQAAMTRIRSLGIDRVRVTAGWSVIAPEADRVNKPDFDATDPAAYPPHLWDQLDRVVRMSRDAGLKTMIDIAFWAPRWATKEMPDVPDRLATEVDPQEYAQFATAVAKRYSGSWTPPPPSPSTPEEPTQNPDRTLLDKLFNDQKPQERPEAVLEPAQPLPAVDMFTIWNEPNHPAFLRPQWVKVDGKWQARSAQIYREMVRAAYPAIKAAAPGSRVLIGGTSSMGSNQPEVQAVPPLRFLREFACVDEQLRPVAEGTCRDFETLPGDGWAHHPYSLLTTPDVDTRDRDKLPVAATGRLTQTLRSLVASGRLAAANANVYMTEYGYETNAPDPKARFSLQEQGGLLAWAEFIATSDPAVRMWPQFQLYDRPSAPPRPGMREFGDWQSGLYFADGSPKPAAATFATPVFTSCVAKTRGRWTLVWGRLRQSGHGTAGVVEARVRGGSWRRVVTFPHPSAKRQSASSSVATDPGHAVRRFVRHRAGTAYRLRWRTSAGERVSPASTPAAGGCRSRKARRS